MSNLNTCCATCFWCEHICDVLYCVNEYSDNCNEEVDKQDTCPEWEYNK